MDKAADVDIIKRVIAGDSPAYAQLVDRYQAMVYTLVLRVVKTVEDAEEVSQDAFLKAYKALPTFKGEAAFGTWLYRIAYNAAVSRARKKQLDTKPYDDVAGMYEVGRVGTAIGRLADEDRKKHLGDALAKLSAEDATLVNLYYLEGLGMDEIAKVVSLTHVNVRVRLSRARKKLYGYLSAALKNEMDDLL